jgi:hypothetical protein
MNLKAIGLKKGLAVGALASLAIGGASFALVSSSSAAGAIQAGSYYQCKNNSSGAVTATKFYDGSGAYPGCGSGYSILYWNQTGPAGPKGDKGDTGAQGPKGDPGTGGEPAQLTVTAQTHLADRADSGRDGSNWALDQFTRTITLTRDHEVSASKCGASATSCWAYFGIESDTGTFKTIAGAKSPEASTPINGVLSGTAAGSQKFELDASSDTPVATNLPASQTGNTVGSTDMPKLLFPAGTTFSAVTEPTFGYDYTATSTCEQWHDGSTGDTGDIQGTNHCTS